MNPVDTSDQEDILAAIVARLVDQIDQLDEQTCWVSDFPIPLSMPAGRYAATVSIGDGNFPREYFGGAGCQTATEAASIIVTPIIATQADRPRRKTKRIGGGQTNAGDAPTLAYFKRSILKALLADPDWEPENNGKALLRDMLSPGGSTAPAEVKVGASECCAIQISFNTVFDWDLKG